MKYSTLTLSALFLSACFVADARCQCGPQGMPPTMGEKIRGGYRMNVDWPRDYIPAARRGVCDTYTAMINNGWRRQNLIGDYHFEPDSNELTQAGQLKVHWILTQAPKGRRKVFVQRGNSLDQTGSRIAAVNEVAANFSPAIESPHVQDTHIVAEGTSASAVDRVFVGFQTNQPAPVLPAAENSGSGGGSSQ